MNHRTSLFFFKWCIQVSSLERFTKFLSFRKKSSKHKCHKNEKNNFLQGQNNHYKITVENLNTPLKKIKELKYTFKKKYKYSLHPFFPIS